MPNIFLSYSHRNEKFMERLKDDLEREGITVWVDDEEIKTASLEWTSKIQGAIKRADCMVVLLSPEAMKSSWVQKEILYAQAINCPICPVLVEGNVRSAIPITVIDSNHVDARSRYSRALAEIVSAIRKGKVNIPTKPSPEKIRQKAKEIIRALGRIGSKGSGSMGRIRVNAYYGQDSKPYLRAMIHPIDDRDALEASQKLELRGWEIKEIKSTNQILLGRRGIKAFVYTWPRPKKTSGLLTADQRAYWTGQTKVYKRPRNTESESFYEILAAEIIEVNELLGVWPEDIKVKVDNPPASSRFNIR